MWPKIIDIQPKFDTEPDLCRALHVSKNSSREDVDRAYHNLLKKNAEYDQITHLAWKVLRDPFYAELYRNAKPLEYLYEAGFFVDKILPTDAHRLDFLPGFLTTPFHKILSNLSGLGPNETPAVLVTTGGFSPIHHGHIAMMEVAKQELERRGYKVVGGYFSPSHDEYVSTKYGGEAGLNGNHRIYLGQLAVDESDWLMVDAWESIFVPTAINFTDVIVRLKKYLNYHIPHSSSPEVFYVFGSDNAKFARVFEYRGGCVCVTRDDTMQSGVQNEDGIKDNQRIIFTKNVSAYAGVSSAVVRKWKVNLMPEKASEVYFKWRKNILRAEGTTTGPRKSYVVRDEDSWAMDYWIKRFGYDRVMVAKEKFKKQLIKALHDAFLYVLLPDLPLEIDMRVYRLEEQIRYVEELERQEEVLNLDMCTNQGLGLNLSRLFYLCDGQLQPSQLIGRPGFPAMDSQIRAIRAGNYTLLDDDLATGSTINMLMGMLPESVRINKIRTLTDYSRRMYHHGHPSSFDQDAFDVVDIRDFILGARASGLVVSLPNGDIARAPYLQPYISLISRASIPPSSEMILSKRLWEMNVEFFNNFQSSVFISDLDEYVQKLFYYLGFKSEMLVVDLCRWYLDKIHFSGIR